MRPAGPEQLGALAVAGRNGRRDRTRPGPSDSRRVFEVFRGADLNRRIATPGKRPGPISTRGSRKPSLPPHTPGTDHLVAPRSLQKETDGLGVILVAVDQGLAGAQMSATGEDFTIPTVSVTVTDIVPLASGDSTGAGLALAALPLIMGGIGGAGMTVIALSMLLGGQAQARHTARTP